MTTPVFNSSDDDLSSGSEIEDLLCGTNGGERYGKRLSGLLAAPVGLDEDTAPRPLSNFGRTRDRWSFGDSSRPVMGDASQRMRHERRLSDATSDAVHRAIDADHISPAQLYSTDSGRLFHAGTMVIILVGLPARGKTHLTVSLTRYLRWLGVKTHAFHVGDYRRAKDGIPKDYFKPTPDTPEGKEYRANIISKCISDVMHFFDDDKGQVAIYDAVNALPEERADVDRQFTSRNIKTLFIESLVTDCNIIENNISQAVKSSPDYVGWDAKEAAADYVSRIHIAEPFYQEIDPSEGLSFIKSINFGERFVLNNSHYGYLINRIVFFLMNSRIKSGSVYFARCHKNFLKFKSDPDLDDEGRQYAQQLTKTVLAHVGATKGLDFITRSQNNTPPPYSGEAGRQKSHATDGIHDDAFVIWTSTRRRTIEACEAFRELGITTRERIQLTQLNPGDVENMTAKEIKAKYPEDYKQHKRDPYHHRYARAESYHDLAVKIEPLILEMERMSGDLLIIADESVLRVFYGYLMACSCYEIPYLKFPTSELIEIKFNAYSNTATRIPIHGVEE
ncbi:hypothetical protein BABINDRAFT_163865 [Babjeviella inositovora NRRL Y-12698]|uniref:6-phosphofructo-2-kinase domain-containing protein n=1 Tax=Babjeviella inositovora NRRL Y-12698 TaxID=984486 RepID=A0A1E3QHQ9_9ASCO|nr:uncharacterized protein BABINDRAFT_163865 [Babjeviella inositovora NRRL Y-12698]ODQ77138.1 hypothetical protein BABINDRAFT_163865 [Babjeviella inositovora NRRL Y-12698]